MVQEKSYEVPNYIYILKIRIPRLFLESISINKTSQLCHASPVSPHNDLRAAEKHMTSAMALVTHDSEPPGSTWARAHAAEMDADRLVS